MPTHLRAACAAAVLASSLAGCGYNPSRYGASLTERECLARAMYFESNRSSEDGMLAVGTVVMNRLQSSRYPKTVCGVVGQPMQFAEGALTKPASGRHFDKALGVADRVLAGERHAGVGAAMFFHTAGYTFPYRNMAYVIAAGGNVFYEKRTPGSFTPIHPATLVAQADRPRRPAEARTQTAARDDEEEIEPPAKRVAPPRRAAAAVEPDDDDEERPPAKVGRRAEPVVVAALPPRPRRETAPPSIAELIELDFKKR